MADSTESAFDLTLESARYQLIGSGLEAALVTTPSGGRAWRCSACRAEFASVRRFDAHLGLHVGMCRRQCHLCDHQLEGTVTQLRRHLAEHIAGQRHACRRCGTAFRSAVDLQQHRRRLHAALFPFRCDLCPRSYSQRAQLRAHCRTHAASPRSHACADCSKRFVTASALHRHQPIHRKRFRCGWPGCSYLARAPTYVRSHIDRVHRKAKRFHCRQCPRGFFAPSVLKLHVRRVHGAPRAEFRCRKCAAVFQSRDSLAVHRRSHVGRHQVCHVCGSAFRSTQALDRHMVDHLGSHAGPHARPYSCDCGKTFRTSLMFHRHWRSHRKGQQRKRAQTHSQPQSEEQKKTDVTEDVAEGRHDRRVQSKAPRKWRPPATKATRKRVMISSHLKNSTTYGRACHSKLASEAQTEPDLEDAGGSMSSVSDADDAGDGPAALRRRPQRVSAARGWLSYTEELFREVLGSSSEQADTTGSCWEPSASDSDRELQ